MTGRRCMILQGRKGRWLRLIERIMRKRNEIG
jgi:hypothetical protein